MTNTKTLYRELLWIARRAGIKDGWAYYRFKEMMERDPTIDEKKGEPIRPNENLVIYCGMFMSDYAYKVLERAYNASYIKEKEERERRARHAAGKKIKATVWRELDFGRPRLDDL